MAFCILSCLRCSCIKSNAFSDVVRQSSFDSISVFGSGRCVSFSSFSFSIVDFAKVKPTVEVQNICPS